ncbi:hypothetical protein JTE90_004503 [Oedothorax gibbosus]|uniref:Uncharacterized protein n=1 Tax=Oedothorax gibbosus TaxID=931172 RepID=A0AAV6U2X7_9ARAC|nr:hypothetical protein JTE90_004503 [Oedothorax gibbosus]
MFLLQTQHRHHISRSTEPVLRDPNLHERYTSLVHKHHSGFQASRSPQDLASRHTFAAQVYNAHRISQITICSYFRTPTPTPPSPDSTEPGLTQQSVPKTGSVPQLQSSAPNSIPGNSLPGQQTSPSSQPGGSIKFLKYLFAYRWKFSISTQQSSFDNIPALRSPEPQSSTISEPISNSQPNLKQPSPQSTTVDFKRAGSPQEPRQ